MRIVTKLNETRESSICRLENTGFLFQSNVYIGRVREREREKRCLNRNNYVRWPVTIRARWWENRDIFDRKIRRSTKPLRWSFSDHNARSQGLFSSSNRRDVLLCNSDSDFSRCFFSSKGAHRTRISCRLWVHSSEIPYPLRVFRFERYLSRKEL